MSYYRGDYYAGGFWSTIKGIGSAVAGFIPGVGGIASKAISAIPTGGAKSGAVASAAGAGMAIVKAGAGAVSSAIIKHPVLSAAGAAGIGLAAGVGGSALMAPGAGAMVAGARGHHMSKPYKCHGTVVPSHLVRNRRMNVCNGRALHRAVRRLHGFARRYRKVVGFVSPKRPKGRMYFRKRKGKK